MKSSHPTWISFKWNIKNWDNKNGILCRTLTNSNCVFILIKFLRGNALETRNILQIIWEMNFTVSPPSKENISFITLLKCVSKLFWHNISDQSIVRPDRALCVIKNLLDEALLYVNKQNYRIWGTKNPTEAPQPRDCFVRFWVGGVIGMNCVTERCRLTF